MIVINGNRARFELEEINAKRLHSFCESMSLPIIGMAIREGIELFDENKNASAEWLSYRTKKTIELLQEKLDALQSEVELPLIDVQDFYKMYFTEDVCIEIFGK